MPCSSRNRCSPLTTSAKFAVVSKSPLTDRINDSLQMPVNIGGRDHNVSASIGITLFPDDAATIDELMVVTLARAFTNETRAFNGAVSFVPVCAYLLARLIGPRLFGQAVWQINLIAKCCHVACADAEFRTSNLTVSQDLRHNAFRDTNWNCKTNAGRTARR